MRPAILIPPTPERLSEPVPRFSRLTPVELAAELGPEVSREVERQAVESLARRGVNGGFAYLGALAVIALGTRYPADYPGLFVPTAIVLTLILMLRVWWTLRWNRYAGPAGRWLIGYRVIMVLLVAVWGLFAGVSLRVYLHGDTGSLILAATIGLSAGAQVSLAPDRWLYRAFLLLILLPSIVLAFGAGESHGFAAAAMVAVGLLFLVAQGNRLHQEYWAGVRASALLAQRARELEEARNLAEVANQTKSRFLAHMSHEIRTPMNGVLGMLTLAVEDQPEGPQRDYLAVARGSAESLLGIIDDILDFSKVEAGRLELAAEPFRLRRLCAEVERLFRPRAEARGLQLDFELADDLPDRLVGDSLRLRQVLTNLLGNALKFTAAGGVTVRLGGRELAPGEYQLAGAVQDTGIGIPAEKQAAIFEAFTQADSSTTRNFGGTGLGLSITRRLVELMQGRIGVRSAPGAGSTFEFTLRLRIAGLDDSTPAAPVPAVRVGPEPAPLRILVAEDNVVNQKVAQAMLTRRGHQVTLVSNGREALDRLGQERFDLVFMDMQMPEMGGLDATIAIRRRERETGVRVPIVALTAGALASDRERCLAAGMDDYLAKPVRPDALDRVLRQCAGPA